MQRNTLHLAGGTLAAKTDVSMTEVAVAENVASRLQVYSVFIIVVKIS